MQELLAKGNFTRNHLFAHIVSDTPQLHIYLHLEQHGKRLHEHLPRA